MIVERDIHLKSSLFPSSGDAFDTNRHGEIQRLVALLQPASASFDRISRIATMALRAEASLVTLVDTDRQVFVGCVGLSEPWVSTREMPLSHSFCQHVAATGVPLLVTDARIHPRFADNGAVTELNVVAYAGVPFFAKDGTVLGSLCVIDPQPREWMPEEIALLTDLALEVQTEIEARTLITEQEAAYAAVQAARDEAERERRRLLDLFTQAPALIAIVEGKNHVIAFANPVVVRTTGRAHAALVGHTVAEIFPEIAGQEIPVALDQVYATGEQRVGAEVLVRYDRRGDGMVEDAYFDLVFQPIRDFADAISGILIFGTEVTDQVRARQQDARMRAYMKHASDLVVVVDAKGVYQYVSPSHSVVMGVSPEDVVGRQLCDFARAEDHAGVTAWFSAALADPTTPHTHELHLPATDGTIHTYESTLVNRLDDPDVRGLVATSHDVTERNRTVAALRESELRLQTVVMNAPVMLFAIDTTGVFTFAEGRGLNAVGLRPEDMVGQNSFAMYRDAPEVIAAMRRALNGDETTVTVALGTVVMQVHFMPFVDANGQVVSVTGVGTDVTERVHAEEALRHQAVHDALTGLPNRVLLQNRLAEALRVAEQEQTTLALLLIDLDHFKEVNDTLGHFYGDELLSHVADVLRQVARPADTVARLGGDEFAVVLPNIDADAATARARIFRDAIIAPVSLNGVVVRPVASVGIALAPAHGTSSTALLRHADIAMYTAKRTRQGVRVYSEAQRSGEGERLALANDLHQAIETDALTLHYQPQVACDDGRLLLVEALTRWNHPTRGLIGPDVFIPLAEETGLITALGTWVLEEALRQCSVWRAAGQMVEVAVNLSIWDLQDDALVTRVMEMLSRHALPPSALHIELTESTLMIDAQRIAEALTRLASYGIAAMIDDFGMGYASFSSLRQLPVEALKIDRTFVHGMISNEMDEAIVRATVGLGKSLGIPVVAEGVENTQTWDLLQSMDCDVAQGYFISPPLTAPDFTRWLTSR